tara:strand:- start:1180 stop:1632 length:453 start_codon:yes stop_codon:yes gene_type:complete
MSLQCPDNNTLFEPMDDSVNSMGDGFMLCYNCCYIKKQHKGYIPTKEFATMYNSKNTNVTPSNDLYKILNTTCKLPEKYKTKCIELSGNNIGNAKILAKTIEQLLINDSEKIDKLLKKINVGDNLWDIDKQLPENEKSLLYLAVLEKYNL